MHFSYSPSPPRASRRKALLGAAVAGAGSLLALAGGIPGLVAGAAIGLAGTAYSLTAYYGGKARAVLARALREVRVSYSFPGSEVIGVRITATSTGSGRLRLIARSATGCAYHVSIPDLVVRHRLPYAGLYVDAREEALGEGEARPGGEVVVEAELGSWPEPVQVYYRGRRGYVNFFEGSVLGVDLVAETGEGKAVLQLVAPVPSPGSPGRGEEDTLLVFVEGPGGLSFEGEARMASGCAVYEASSGFAGNPARNLVVAGRRFCWALAAGRVECGDLAAGYRPVQG